MECHSLSRRDPEGGRVHVMPGRFIDMVRSAVVLTGARGEDGIARVLQNAAAPTRPMSGAGHPTCGGGCFLPRSTEPGPWRYLTASGTHIVTKDLAGTLLLG